jgi:hypothetical protein
MKPMNHREFRDKYWFWICDAHGGPPPFLYALILVLGVAWCLYSLYVHAESPRRSSCSWQRCKVEQEGRRVLLVDCEPAQYGSHLDLAFAFQQIHEPNHAIKYVCEPVKEQP